MIVNIQLIPSFFEWIQIKAINNVNFPIKMLVFVFVGDYTIMKKRSNTLINITVFLCSIQLFSCSIFTAIAKDVKIVVVKSKDLLQYNKSFDGFREELRKAGVNFQAKMYSLDKSYQPIAEIVTEIIREKPDLILTIGTKASQEISQRISDLPILFSIVLDPEAQGLKHSTARPLKNLSGVCLDIPVEIQFKVLKQALFDLKRIAVLYHPSQDSVMIERAKETATKLGIELIGGEIKSEEDIPPTLKSIRSKSDVLWLITNPQTVSYSSLKYILMFCISNNFPIIGLSEFHVKAGALLALRADYYDTGRQVGKLALEILHKGLPDGQIIIAPRKTRLFVNKKMTEMMGIEIPATILKQAEQI